MATAEAEGQSASESESELVEQGKGRVQDTDILVGVGKVRVLDRLPHLEMALVRLEAQELEAGRAAERLRSSR